MSFLTPLGFIGALLAGPIILMYMLRLRRREVLVSSTFLWRQVLQDNEANTPWQKLRRNLLLLLQLLILAFLVFALARPFVTVPAVSTGQIALLLDASSSMNAVDAANGDTRFETAKQRALSIVDTMGADDTMTVIRVADVPEVLSPQTQDANNLRNAINSAEPSTTRADWNAALTLAAGTSSANNEDFNVVIVSDGGLGDTAGLPGVRGEISYVPVGVGDGNVAISALATRSLGGASPQLFAQIRNYGTQDAEVILDLEVDGEIFTAERYSVPAGETVSVTSDALPSDYVVIEAGITPASGSDTEDFLPDDNTAYAVTEGSGNIEALVISEGNRFVDRVLGSLPTVNHVNGTPGQGVPSRPFDLYVFDSYLPDPLPDADMLIINPPRSPGIFTVGEPSEDTGNPALADSTDLTAFLDVDSLNILEFRPVTASWLEPMVTVDGGPVILTGENRGRQIAVLAFALSDSDLPLQITFPILMNNLMDWYRPEGVTLTETAVRTGESLTITPPLRADRVRVTKPDGSRREFTPTAGAVIYADSNQLGVYGVEIFAGSEELQTTQFAVNLFDAAESDISPREQVMLGDAVITEAADEEELGQREFWRWLALLALLVLMIEWFVYHQRLAGPKGVFRPIFQRRSAS